VHKALARSFAVLTLFATMTAHAASATFPDMQGRWFRYRENVDYLVGRGVIDGYPDGTFKPDQTINRAEFLKLVFHGRSSTTPIARRCFSDVSPREWYAPYVCAAKARGIVDGYANGTFKPAQVVTFAEALKIAANAYNWNVTEQKGEGWYEPYVKFLDDKDVLSEHSFLPWAELTRERAADLLARMIRYDEDKTLANLSSGCLKADPQVPVTTVMVDGQERSFLLAVPSGYVSHDPVPLIIAFHGRTNSNDQVEQYYGLRREASDAIVAYPAGLPNGKGFTWTAPGDKGLNQNAVRFFDALVEQLSSQYCIDMDDITVVGHSLGAWAANTVACARGGIVLASATVGGDGVIADCPGPSAAFVAHNPHDTLASFDSTKRMMENRLKENGCFAPPEPVPNNSLNCETYSCANGTDVQWCPHTQDTDERGTYYPHNWPRETATYIMHFFRDLAR